MPAASSTRAVALLMLGIIDGCTQPASINTLRACSRFGHSPASWRTGTLLLSFCGNAPRTAWPSFMAGPNKGDVSPSFKVQRNAFAAAPRSTFSSTILRPMSTRCPYSTPLGQVLSQLRQVRQRSRCNCVLRVGASPSSICLIR
jgi:hypothetical protein